MDVVASLAENRTETLVGAVVMEAVIRVEPGSDAYREGEAHAKKGVLEAEVELVGVVDPESVELGICVWGKMLQTENIDETSGETAVLDVVVIESKSYCIVGSVGKTEPIYAWRVKPRGFVVQIRKAFCIAPPSSAPGSEVKRWSLSVHSAEAPPLVGALPEKSGGEAPV